MLCRRDLCYPSERHLKDKMISTISPELTVLRIEAFLAYLVWEWELLEA